MLPLAACGACRLAHAYSTDSNGRSVKPAAILFLGGERRSTGDENMNSLDRQPARTPAARPPAVPLVPLHGVQTEAAEGGMFGHAVWQQVRDTALDVSRREPLLLRRMQQLVLRHAGPAAILASVLARRMASEDLPEPVLQELMQRVLESDESAMQHATRDLAAVKERDPACTDLLHVVLNLKGYQALQAHRVGHALWRSGRKELAFALASQASLAFAVDIHPAARIGSGVMLDHGTGIVIGETTVIEDDVSILQNVTLGGTGKEHGDRHPKIRSGVMIGAGAKILGNIEIGTMSKVAAGSVVLKPVPPHSTVAGVPAKVVRRQQDDSCCPSMEMDQTI
jgi:serine O-acetyltransferase